MADLLQITASFTWLALAVLFFARLRQWDKKFSDLYDELKRQIEEDE